MAEGKLPAIVAFFSRGVRIMISGYPDDFDLQLVSEDSVEAAEDVSMESE